ncbi:OrNV gp124-like protein [Tomelloso virus]|uniref:OrNV gp124-like protein n=1 Tax=Tomelloso virus TaxID=2053981 RepID=A0A2H4T2V4_9VIRU|nr:OrNV gp124-like protein [Tomelloso virus]ATY70198.1 OrNV gp124-like protein [Tomelloso virus]
MTGVYTFGGARQDNGKVRPIDSNDRKFKCGFGVCELAPPTASPVAQEDLFNMDFQLFDIADLRANLSTVSAEVTDAYRNILKWFDQLEQNFALKIQMGDIPMNITLFNKLNIIIPKFAAARKVMDAWYTDYTYMVTDLSDLFSLYSEAAAKLQANRQATTTGGISENVITLAKQNLTRMRSIQKLISRIITLDAQIRSSLQNLTFKLNELTTGILRYDGNKILNLIELSNAIASLGEGDSPLVQIQTQLSNVINSTPLNFSIRTQPPEKLPNVNYDPNTIYSSKNLTAEAVLEKLQVFKDITMYTTSTKPMVDSLQSYIENNFKNDVQYPAMKTLIERIKVENIPNVFLDTLQMNAANPDGIYLTIDTVGNVLSRLPPADAIYSDRLKNILDMALSTAKNSRDADEPMNI